MRMDLSEDHSETEASIRRRRVLISYNFPVFIKEMQWFLIALWIAPVEFSFLFCRNFPKLAGKRPLNSLKPGSRTGEDRHSSWVNRYRRQLVRIY